MKQKTASVFIGVDVASRALVATTFGASAVHTLPNQKTALSKWLAALPAHAALGVESTGGYHELLAGLAHARGLTVYVLNPKDLRHYAQGIGRRGKTDDLDARVIARYIANEHTVLHPWQPPTPAQAQLARLLKRRAKLITAQGMIRASFAHVDGLKRERADVLASIKRLVDAIERELLTTVHALPQGRVRFEQLRSIPGIGHLSGAALLHLFTRLGFKDSDAPIAYSGLDPRPADSGQKIGRRRLSKRGPAELRRLLYNAAMAAAKTKVWKPYYQRQRAKGLSTTAAFVVLARKLIRVAFALFKQDAYFDPTRALAA
jgi:transposase